MLRCGASSQDIGASSTSASRSAAAQTWCQSLSHAKGGDQRAREQVQRMLLLRYGGYKRQHEAAVNCNQLDEEPDLRVVTESRLQPPRKLVQHLRQHICLMCCWNVHLCSVAAHASSHGSCATGLLHAYRLVHRGKNIGVQRSSSFPGLPLLPSHTDAEALVIPACCLCYTPG
jgi:hypothetical protein